MTDLLFRCSSLGKLMTEPVSIAPELITPEVAEIVAKKKRTDEEKAILADLKARTLSEGAKTHIRELAAQAIFGVDFGFTSKQTDKGIECEDMSIALLNSVRGLALTKNIDRRDNGLITGECDLFDAPRRRGHDLKTSWSIATFPIVVADCEDKLYEWQMRGYMMLWDADEWEVNYCLVNTPENLIGYEPLPLHIVDHIPAHHRVTTWLVKRDPEKEALIERKVRMAREYYAQVIAEFDRSHTQTATSEDPCEDITAQVMEAGAAAMEAISEARQAEDLPTQLLDAMEEVATGIITDLAIGRAADAAKASTAAVIPMPTKAPSPAPVTAGPPTLKLGEVQKRLAASGIALNVSAAYLAGIGIEAAGREGSAILFSEHQWPAICDALISHIAAARDQRQAA